FLIFVAGVSFRGWLSKAAKSRLLRSGTLATRTRSSQLHLRAAQSSPPRPLGLCIADMQSPCPLENSTRHALGVQMHPSSDNPPGLRWVSCIEETRPLTSTLVLN